jgi:hypothetical protein
VSTNVRGRSLEIAPLAEKWLQIEELQELGQVELQVHGEVVTKFDFAD